ncbi:MAG: Smr/MutS family protein [Acidobacteria bacterium]|nr:Smr/MutS family protein [Acidobacteriota bacterium]
MHAGTQTALEFDRVVDVVASHALTPLGADALAQMRPLTDRRAVQTALAHTTEGVRFLAVNEGGLPLEAPRDLAAILSRLAIEAHPLAAIDLRRLADFLQSLERSCQAVRTAGGGPYPALTAIVNGSAAWTRECEDVVRKIDDAGEVNDDASPELKTIRGRLRKQRNRLRGNLESFLRGRETVKYLQERVVTERNGRFVLVVRSEHRTAIPGIVHGSSTSGASLFLEPLSTVDLNNEIVALEQHEEDEVRRVLMGLSSGFRRRAADLRRTLTAATDLDMVQARAAFSTAIGAVEPTLADDESFELRAARHPLLMNAVTSRLEAPPRADAPDGPVPVDIVMRPPDRALIVTGPNTGGKTVALKTAGLLALMAQAGLHVPAAEGSVLPVFRSVFADIGDEQSIAANLSTFSGHLSNIVAMDRRLALPGLILLDEVGAGTDPVEGGALGCAVVEHFRARGAHVIATSHDDVLKSYGATTAGAAVAAFGFDPETFAPTYRLIYGSAGRSLALEIAGRLGLAPEIITAAADRRSAREAQLAEHLARIDSDRRKLDELREELAERDRSLTARAAEMAGLESELEEREAAGRKRLEQSLGERLRSARGEIDAIVGGLRERVAALEREAAGRIDKRERALSTGDSGALRAEAQSALEEVARKMEVPPEEAPPAPAPAAPSLDVEVGAWVTVSTLGVDGAVRSLHGADADVEVNGKRLRVPLASLRAASGRPRTPRRPDSRVAIHVEEPVGPLEELNVIGCRVEEALSRVEKHLDHVLMSETRTVRFVHGHGTGQLRRSIKRFLDTHPCVRRVSAAPPEDGGGAVTIAELKE